MKVNLPNVITTSRILLAFVTVILLRIENYYTLIAAIFLIIFVVFLDFLDGFVARRLGLQTEFGALYDITGDRIVEYIYWIYFSVVHITSFWYAILVIARGEIVNTLRATAYRKGKTPYQIHKTRLARFLVTSPFMRTSYAVLKAVAFSSMGLELFLRKKVPDFVYLHHISAFTSALAFLTVVVCILRGLPVIIDTRDYIK